MGGLRVYRNGEELASLPAKPLRAAMLVHVAVERDVSREGLCYLLWPDSDPERARHALSQTLYELRKELGDAWVEAAADRLRITDEVEVDVHALADAASAARHEDVIDSYAGPFLDGIVLGGGVEFEHWVEEKRSEVHRSVRAALREATAAAADPESRLRHARALVRLDPLDDEAQHALIECLALAGHRTDALEQYGAYRDLIASELEIEPLDHTRELVEAIRSGTLPAEPISPVQNRTAGRAVAGTAEANAPPPATHRGGALEVASDLKVARLIGTGSTGSVYLAREPALKRLVAVKVLDPELSEHETARARFEREAQSAARILHPHVATVYRVGVTTDGRPYFVMPYVKGATLADRIKARGPFPPQEVRRLLAEAASALAAAHAASVIHRDVRPANVLHEEGTGRTYLMDFGVAGVLESGDEELARLTRTGELLGNPEYISPEQRNDDELTDRSDVYSLGVMGRELLLGRRSSDDRELLAMDCDDKELIDVLRRATSENPRHRPSAAEVGAVLSRPPAQSTQELGLIRKLWRRRVLPFVGAYLAGGLAAMGTVDQLVQQDLLPPVAYRLALAFFLAGLCATSIVVWFHGARGRQRMPRAELALLTVVLIAWLMASALIVL